MAASGRTRAIVGALAAILATAPAFAGAPADALVAASADPFSALVGERRGERKARRDAPAVERFTVAADGRVFLLEGGVGDARIKFLCTENDPRLDCRIDPAGPAEEIHLVTGARGPRGDVIYKNREGDVLLRMTSYGGATVYWPGDHQGQAASRSFGDDGPLVLPPVGLAAAERRSRTATAVLSAVTGEPIVFDVGAAAGDYAPAAGAEAAAAANPAPGADVLSDAIIRVAVGMQRVAADPTGARILGVRVKSVEFRPGTGPLLSLDGSTLIVVYNPAGDVAGRPSSVAVARFLEDSL